MPERDPIAAQMRQARENRGWSLEAAAAKTGIPAVVIGSYERGDRQPPLHKLREWVEAFGHQLIVLGPQPDSEGEFWAEYRVRYGETGLILCTSRDEALEIATHMPEGVVASRQVHAGEWVADSD